MVLPLRDSGGDVGTDSRLFSNDEKKMWREQLLQNVVLQSGFVSKRDKSLWNVFGEMLKTMETEGGETAASRAMIQAVLSMEASFRTPAFDTAYLQFVLLVGENKDDCGEKMGMHLLKLMELLEQ